MPMRRTILISSVVVALAAAPIASSQRASRAELRFQEAHRKETIDGDLKAAIDLYRRAAGEAGSNRAIAAQALVRMGECYEKLGDAEARKAYERVAREFGDQKDLAEMARTRLSALQRSASLRHPAGITLRKVWEGMGSLAGSPSPDGRYHTFTDWETGDLVLRDLTTGQNRRLTNKGAWEQSEEYAEASVISGDAKLIAYAWFNKEGFYEIRVCGIDGSNSRTVYRDKEFGYWLEPYQWTADGKQILAALMKREPKAGRIALIPGEGGRARILPTRAQVPWYPSLSPDGRFLVYSAGTTAGAEVFLLSLEGGQESSIVPVPYAGWGPVWTPDGKKILFTSDRTGTNGLWTIDVVESKPRGAPQLLKDGLGREIRPNGFTRQGAFYFSTNTSIADVYVAEVDLAAGKVVREPAPVTPRLARSNLAPSWSPDGRRLAYYSRPEWAKAPTLVILSVETGEARDVPIKLDLFHRPVPVRWFPDGESVLVSAYESPKRDEVAFYRVDAQTGDHRLVRSSPGPGPLRAELSPDGKTIFFFTGGEQKLWGGVISRDIETGQEREITRVPFMWPESGWTELAVSPDGRYLAFRRPVDEFWTALMLVPAAGGELRELYRYTLQSEPQRYGELSWTRDGRNVLFVRGTGRDKMPELWRIPVSGGEPQRVGLSAKGMRVVSPHPDGRRIAFESGTPSVEANELWVLENISAAAESKATSGTK